MINTIVDLGLLGLLVGIALTMLRSQSPLSLVILSGIYSLVVCSLFVILDAVDVAFTEAAVGAGISTILFLCVVRPGDEPADKLAWSWPSPIAIILGLSVGVLVMLGTLDMPLYGDPQAPAHNYLIPRFLGESYGEIGIPNVVTSVLASYRGYDTLGEVVVIFTAGIAVFILLASATSTGNKGSVATEELGNNPIIRTVLIRIIPLVVLFALYVQFHGDYGPGGGFQAGVIFGAGLITYGLVTTPSKLRRVVPERGVVVGMVIGVLLYGLVGVVSLLKGGTYLNYSVLGSTQTGGQHLGILLIELGVGITVACTMMSLYFSFNQEN